MNRPSKQRHIKDIASGCGVKSLYGSKCGCHVVGRVIRNWRLPVCELHAESMVKNGFAVKRYSNERK